MDALTNLILVAGKAWLHTQRQCPTSELAAELSAALDAAEILRQELTLKGHLPQPEKEATS